MTTALEIVRVGHEDWFEPEGHWLVRSHWIVEAARDARVQLCQMEVGGGAESHVHDSEEQVFYLFDGELEVKDGTGGRVVVGAGEALRIPAGVPHATTNPGDRLARYLVATSAAQ